ncbi:MAG: HNH endonuclease [Gemmatimonadales bacterium]
MTSLDLDWGLRLAALEAVRRGASASGGVMTRAQMSAGFEFEGAQVPLALQARGIWKPGRLGPTGAALSITTASVKPGILPRYNDTNVSEDGWFEYKYQGTDPSAADNRAVRKAFELGRPLIYFYGIAPGLYEAIAPVYVVGDELTALTFRVGADATGVANPRLMAGGAEAPLKAYATATVKIRLHQHRFRQMVVAAYGERCAVCRLRHPELLDAAHILEDRDERGKPEVPNGLALCGVHHGAYDANIMGIAPDQRIHIRKDILAEIDGPMLRHGLQEMHGSLIRVPRRADLKPRAEYLEERFARFRAA